LKHRALYQAARLQQFTADSGGALTLVRTKSELAAYLEKRKTNPKITAGMLGIEGAQVLEGDPANVDAMFEAGYRYMSPAHFFDTEMGGSAHGVTKGGLTERGRDMVRRMESRRMIIDVAHASPQTLDDILQMAARPVIVSHTGVKGVCDNRRNLSDAQLRAIAGRGGLVGIGYWETAVCGADAAAVARAMRHAARVAGVEHIALGSDFDGAVAVPFDASGLVLLTDALINEGFSNDDIAKIMGGNALRFFAENLPE
jgi:microsomal dipeptidase-like Zn-dependent dipeptidase